MNWSRYFGTGGLAVVISVAPAPAASEGVATGVTAAWADGTDDEAALARAVAEYPLSNAELLASLAACRPPQSWYDEDHEGLY